MSAAATEPGPWRVAAIALLCLVVQALSSFIALSVPVLAPSIAASRSWSGALVGYYPFFMYVGALAATFGGMRVLHGIGPLKVSLISVALSALGLSLMLGSTLAMLVLGALVIGLGYGPVVPATSHVLSAGTGRRYANLIFSFKQTGAPLGGLVAGLCVPPLVDALSLQGAVTALTGGSIVACLLLAATLPFAEVREPAGRTRAPRFFEPIADVLRIPTLRRMMAASFTYSGMQLCLGAFLPVYLVERQGLSLSAAGWIFGASQIGSIVGRLALGWIADRLLAPFTVVVGLGFAMALCAVGVAVFTPAWPLWAMAVVSCLFGATALGWNGVLYAEVARLAPAGRAGVMTSGAVSINFLGVLLGPLLFSAVLAATGGYEAGFAVMAAFVTGGAAIALFGRRRRTI
ncbi:MFS transporter [Bosea sp. (in: a-proteobacteria)]|uniref:MFS transporter n=1 Tax=Bosea sp. (in: a-proteobacteria) TaxID=1871050 RepID=UPI0026152688|nr:MFS transporter [Bosea sp. (in: a-proteobacteria)]MCO5093162.1 MFS transporter [Bosea sp. (in: a-proteobacteria)]